MSGRPSRDSGQNRVRSSRAKGPERHRRLSAILSPALKSQFGVKSMVIRKGDTVVVRRGDWTLQEGRVMRVDSGSSAVFVENIKREGADGKEVLAPLRAENLMITKLDLDDKMRKKIMQRRGYSETV